MGKSFDFRLVLECRWSLVNRCFLRKEDEESIDHILLHCSLVRMLWKLLFDLFGIHWVQSTTIKEALFGWHDAFVGKKMEKGLESCSFIYFLDGLEGKKSQSV